MQINWSALSSRGALGRLVRQPLRLIPKNAVVPVLQGRLRGAKWIVGSFNHGCWLGSYEMDKCRIIEDTVGPGSILFDIGANVGYYSLLGSRLVGISGCVVAFEPAPRNVSLIRRHLALNGASNVIVVDAAVSDTDGTATFVFAESNAMGHLGTGSGISVRTVALDSYVEQTSTVPDCLKIDVEGAEAQVLRGARGLLSSRRPAIFLSTHGDTQKAECMAILRSTGYSVSQIDCDEFVCK